MDANLQRRVQRYGWDKAAAYYETLWAQQIEPAQTRLLQFAALERGERVLDVACGTGLVTLKAAASVGPEGMVVGTDISEAMVRRLVANADALGLGNTTALRMDAEALNFPEAHFDAVLCALGLMYVPNPQLALENALRVLRPGGRTAIAVWGARTQCGWAEIFSIVDRRVASDVCPMFFQAGTGDALQWLLETAGFQDIRTERINTTLRYDSGESACDAAFAGGPVALAYSRFDEAMRAEAQAEYLASIESYRRGTTYDVPGEFVVARAGKGE